MDDASARGLDRRRLIGWGGVAAAGAVAPLVSPGIGQAGPASPGPSARERIPPDARPGGAYDRNVARLAAEDKFAGVVLLSHRGRTILSRSYGMADEERRTRHHEGTAFSLSSAGKPFHAVAVLQLAQQGRVRLADPIGEYLTGFPADIADRVTVHHVLSGTSGLNTPELDVRRIFRSRQEVRDHCARWARQARLVGIPGTPTTAHAGAETAIPALIVEAVTGMTYWDYVEENIFRRSGMTGSAFYTRPRWLTDRDIAHPYMTVAGGRRVDAVRNLELGSSLPYMPGWNPGRAFIDAPGDGGFATAPDLVRFARGLGDGTLLDRPWADVLTAAKTPVGQASFGAYGIPIEIVGGQWVYQRAGGNPGVGANWSIYPDTGWVGVILSNRDDIPLIAMMGQESQAITGVAPGNGNGG
ncbi:CubicO group peptidase (beta-lactamase class C family) [Actinoplanes lutulentus]|nr:serine hydrolase domain-containing protein [Actinoplanes lutulentus]MBB2948552.1 CubicO group peptidase (beta-lactamase class C family) [Actinoplanes lutulentus]